ncbi:MAG: PEP-CTERM sorting domain-containing protein [Burkholderiales bacterium]|nr:PEP-CTERM sorting domain-containing protein [Burkholderiales bacterium]
MSQQVVGLQCENAGVNGRAWKLAALAAGAVLALLEAAPGQAAVIAPTITVTVDGQVHEIPYTTAFKDAGAAGVAETYVVDGYKIVAVDEYEIAITRALLDPDPSISYSLSVTDFGAPSTFMFTFFTPIVPTGFPNLVTASLAGTLTDSTGDGVTITPVGPTIQTSFVGAPLTTMGVGVDIGESVGPIAGPGGSTWTQLSVETGFTLSGGGDVAALLGFAGIVEGQLPTRVPEPGALALVGVAFAALLAARRR